MSSNLPGWCGRDRLWRGGRGGSPRWGGGGGGGLLPLLPFFFPADLRYAIGASLFSVIATSSGAAAAYVREGYSNIRIGMFLEIATTLGALLGAYPAFG